MTALETSPARQHVRLHDGRTLSYLELGDPSGVAVLFTMGSPSSAVGALGYAPAAERNGVRLISIDKPGYGHSTRDPQRSLLRYGQDVTGLADALGLDRVAVAGQSGGGPHALATAHVLGARVSTLTLLCSYGPAAEPWAREGLNGTMRTMTWFAMHAPQLMAVPVAGMKLMLGDADRVERLMKRMAHKMSPAELEAANSPESHLITAGIADAYRTGSAGVCDEFRAIGQPWGFRLEDVAVPTDMWHGTDDKSCPITMARGLAKRLPNATLHELPGLGHVFFGAELDQAFATLREKSTLA